MLAATAQNETQSPSLQPAAAARGEPWVRALPPFVGTCKLGGMLLFFTQQQGDLAAAVRVGLAPEFSARRSLVQGRSDR